MALRKHILLFYIRYLMLARNARPGDIERTGCFNDYNSVDDIPALFREVNKRINVNPDDTDLNKSLQIAAFLRGHIKAGPAISASSGKTLKIMLERGGVCGDFSQIFNLFCLLNGIRVREWHCVSSFFKTEFGHTFNEIYDPELQKWIALDSHKGILFKCQTDHDLLSATELFQTLRQGKPVNFEYFSDYRPPNPERLKSVFSATTIPFLIDNYRNKTVDVFSDKLSPFPAPVIQAALFIFRKNYQFVFVHDNYRDKLFPFFGPGSQRS